MPPPQKNFSKFKKPFKRSYNSNDSREESSEFGFKRAKTATDVVKKEPDGQKHVDDEGNPYWELGGRLRRVTVSQFKGNVLVSVREYYEKDGRQLPGSKGISMSLDQFNQLIKVLPSIEQAIGDKSSAKVNRPIYTDSSKYGFKGQLEEGEEVENEEKEESEDERPLARAKTVKKLEKAELHSKDGEDEEEEEEEEEGIAKPALKKAKKPVESEEEEESEEE